MKPWKTSQDILEQIQDAFDKLRAGESDVEQARAEAHLLKTATKMIEIQLDHAKLTGRLSQGSADLPSITFSPKSIKP